MYKFSELVGTNLIDANTQQELGAITNIVWDKPSGKCALVTDNGAYSAEKIISADGTTVTVIAASKTDVGETLTGKFAFETSGSYLCKVSDVEFGNTLKLSKVHLEDNTVYNRGRILAVKDVLLIRAPTPPRPKKTVAKTTDTEVAVEQPVVTATTIRTPNTPWHKNRKYGDFSFLIGKVTDKTITNFQGEVMVKLGERVTHTILRQAKISGKLIELCLHTK